MHTNLGYLTTAVHVQSTIMIQCETRIRMTKDLTVD